jgi:uncharacterized protein
MAVTLLTLPLPFVAARGEGVLSSARIYPASSPARDVWLLLGHGAGAGQDSPFIVSFAEAFAGRGIHVATFNFLYAQLGRRLPDPTPTLEACCVAAIHLVRAHAGNHPIFIGGKSMGGRIASRVASARDMASFGVAGLVLFGYPLHPPGQPDRLRTDHWPGIRVPALFVHGSRAPFGSPAELREALAALGAGASLHLVDCGDHSFRLPRATKAGQAAALTRVQDVVVEWMTAMAPVGR